MIWVFLVLLSGSMVMGQEYEFVREGRSFRFVEKLVSYPLVEVDRRPLWKRLAYSIRPWVSSSPGTRLEWDEGMKAYALDGSMGIGLRGKVEF